MKDIPLQEKYKLMSDDKNNCDCYIKFHFTRTINIKGLNGKNIKGLKVLVKSHVLHSLPLLSLSEVNITTNILVQL